MAEDTPATGRAKVRGEEETLSIRQQVAARSYILGLERDREQLHVLREQIVTQGWEVIRLTSISRALVRVIRQLQRYEVVAEDEITERTEFLLQEVEDIISEEIVTCPCGHSKYDHDELGCMYLHCRGVCA